MKKVLLIGATGMLGSMMSYHFGAANDLEVFITTRNKKDDKTRALKHLQFDVLEFLDEDTKYPELLQMDYIINCVGIIKPFCHDDNMDEVFNAIRVNSEFPHRLAQVTRGSKARIVQIATDCVYDGKEGNYDESAKHDAIDVYGKTKSLGEVQMPHFLNIRSSIIGPEQKGYVSLLEWFLRQPEEAELSGYSNHLWNGVTTLQFAQLCENIIRQDAFDSLVQENHTHHFIPNTTVSKYELLQIFKEVFQKNYTIKKVSEGITPVDRTLSSKYSSLEKIYGKKTMKEALQELQSFMSKLKLSVYAK